MSNETKPVSKEQWEEICELAGLPADSKRYNLSEVDMRRVAAYAISQQTAALREELEAVKKENADWKARNLEYSYQVAVKSCVMLQGQLDEATELLSDEENIGFLEWDSKRRDFFSRLSSGETKPGSQWISVKDQVPKSSEPVYIFFNGEVRPAVYEYDQDDEAQFWVGELFVCPVWWMPRLVPSPPELNQ